MKHHVASRLLSNFPMFAVIFQSGHCSEEIWLEGKAPAQSVLSCGCCGFLSVQWYMVSIVHTFNRIKANEVQVFVNGQHASRAELPFVTSKEVGFFSSFFHSTTRARVQCMYLKYRYVGYNPHFYAIYFK